MNEAWCCWRQTLHDGFELSNIVSRTFMRGRRNISLQTNSAVVHCRSSLKAIQIFSNTWGNASIHCSGCGWALRAAFNCLWNRSTRLFGWCAVVWMRFELRRCMRSSQSANSNWHPQSVVIVEGVPNRDIHPWTNTRATTSAIMSAMGMASGHLVKRSMHVSKYVYPREDGNDQWFQ